MHKMPLQKGKICTIQNTDYFETVLTEKEINLADKIT